VIVADTGIPSAVTESRAGRGIFRLRPAPGKPGRLNFIDVLRGWAVLVMIETHVLNGMLDPIHTHSLAFKVLNFINGLVAPAFLFASGMAFALATRRKLADYLSLRPPLFRQLGRLGLLFIIGYGLHIPKFEYHHLRYDAGEAAWRSFAQVDVLQCIAVSLLILLLLLLMLRTERRVYAAAGVLLTGIVFTTPLIWEIDFWNLLPIPLAEYFNGLHASLFPLFPWAAFVLAGALSGYYYLESSGAATRSSALLPGHPAGPAVVRAGPAGARAGMLRFVWLGIAMAAASFMVEPLASVLYPVYDYWKTSPSFTMLRMGLVMLILAGLYFYERARGFSPSSLLALAGRESLLVYSVHLMIIYGNFNGPHLVDRIAFRFGFPEVFGLSALLIALMVVLALVWNLIKAGPAWIHRGVELAVVAGFAYVFFVGI
jgi:uncharacterized membrane protein